MRRHKWGKPDECGDQRCAVCGLVRAQVANERRMRGKPRGTHWEYVTPHGLRTYAGDCATAGHGPDAYTPRPRLTPGEEPGA